jgi:3-oxoacyl-[acyl-carrier protein] reductase
MSKELQGKQAVVLGGSQGLGFATAKSLVTKGAKVCIISRSEGKLITACKELAELSGIEHEYIVCDQSDMKSVDEMVGSFKTRFSRIDILILNSGGPKFGFFDTLSFEDWSTGTNMILNSFLKVLQGTLPIMKKNGGSIISITSISASRPIKGLTLSNVIRPAIEGLMRTIAEEYAEFNINAVSVEPGMIFTDRIKSIVENGSETSGRSYEQELDERIGAIPLKRFGDPEQFGNFVSFFATKSGRYVTGQTLIYDGGIQLR